jgi:hypothetical protein
MPGAKRNTGFKTSTGPRERVPAAVRGGASKARIRSDESTSRKTRRRRLGLSAAELANKVRRLPWLWVLTAAEEARVVRLVARGGLPTLRSGRLRAAQQRLLAIFGMASALIQLFNDAYWGPRIRSVYAEDGWWGIVMYLYAQRDHLAEVRAEGKRYAGDFLLAEAPEGWSRSGGEEVVSVPARSLEALMEAVQFARWSWRLTWCPGRGGHWYVRLPRGRAPKGCPLHARALRQARWRQSPKRQMALKGRSARTTIRPSRR